MPAFKIKVTLGIGTVGYLLFIDKNSFLLVKHSIRDFATNSSRAESYPSDYAEINGVFLPMKTTDVFLEWKC
jgi:hypothetical protein